MNEQTNVAYPYNDTLLRHPKEWSTDTCSNMDKLQKHAKSKKPDTKYHMLYIPFMWNFQKNQIYRQEVEYRQKEWLHGAE